MSATTEGVITMRQQASERRANGAAAIDGERPLAPVQGVFEAFSEYFLEALRGEVEPLREQVMTLAKQMMGPAGPHSPRTSGDEKRWLLVEEVAARCGVTAPTVRGWITSGRLRAKKPGHRYLVHVNDLETFVAARDAEEVEERDFNINEAVSSLAGRIGGGTV